MTPSQVPSQDTFFFNLRTLSAPQSGVQRYARELNSRFSPGAMPVSPAANAQGVIGHLWEQFILPLRCRGRLLFSPGNSGPLLHRQQVVTIHDASTFDCADAFAGLFGGWYRWLLPRLAKRVLGVITVSHFSRDRLAVTMGIPREKIAVVYNGVTLPPTAPSKHILNELRTRLNLPARFLLFVGSRDPRKNVDRLIAAFDQLNDPQLHLVLAGGGNAQLFNAGQTNRANPNIHALGHVDEATLECLYHLAEGFVFPAVYEGFGLPPLEAMARGCPVLCSDATCLPEVCGPAFEDGGACLYFSPHQTESIAHALRKFASLPPETKKHMTEAGRHQASLYSWDRCARETVTALQGFSPAKTLSTRTSPIDTARGLLRKSEADSR